MDSEITNFHKIKFPTYFFVFYILLVPFESVLFTRSIVNISYATYAAGATMIAMLLFLISKRKFVKLSKGVIPWIGYFLWAGLSIYWSIDRYSSATSYFYLARFLIFFIIIGSYPFNEFELKIIRRAVIISGVLVSILLIGSYVYLGQFSNIVRATLFLNDNSSDPNHIAATMILPIAFVLSEAMKSKGLLKIWDLLSFGLIFTAILLSGSRGAFLAFIALIATSIYQYRPKARKIRTLLSASFIIISICFAIISFEPALYNRYVPTLNLDQYSSGRMKLWKESFTAWSQKPLFGYGYGSFQFLGLTYINRFKAAHNIFIQTLVELGIPGIILLLLIIYSTLAFKSTSNFLRAIKAGVFGILVSSIFIHTLNYDYLWLGLIFAEIASREKPDDNPQVKTVPDQNEQGLPKTLPA